MSMKIITKITGFFFVPLFVLCVSSCAPVRKVERAVEVPRFEIEAMPTGIKGTYLLKVWTYSTNPMPDFKQVKRNAVYGVLFEGFKGKRGIAGQKPIVPNPKIKTEKAEFFNAFFAEGGAYLNFVDLVNDGAIAAGDRIRMGDLFRIGIVSSVKAAELRKHLEEAGIIPRLGEGFY